MRIPTLIVATLALTLTACGQRNKPATVDADTVRLNHASLLTMVEADSFTLVAVDDPWHTGQELRRYVLIDRSRTACPKAPSSAFPCGEPLFSPPSTAPCSMTSAKSMPSPASVTANMPYMQECAANSPPDTFPMQAVQ